MAQGDVTSHTISKSSARRSIKKKAGGRYAADLVLQLPARGSGSVALHSVARAILISSAQRRLTRAFLQHGSLLLGPDQAQIARYLQAPGENRAALAARLMAETIDVETAAGRRVSLEELGDRVIEALIERHGALVIPQAELPDAVRRAAEERRPAVRVSPGAVDSREPAG